MRSSASGNPHSAQRPRRRRSARPQPGHASARAAAARRRRGRRRASRAAPRAARRAPRAPRSARERASRTSGCRASACAAACPPSRRVKVPATGLWAPRARAISSSRCSAGTTVTPAPATSRSRPAPSTPIPRCTRCSQAARHARTARSRARASLRQPQPADGPDRAGRLRHGLHARHLPPARLEQLSFEMTLAAAGRGAAATRRRSRALQLRPRLRDARARRSTRSHGNMFKMDRYSHVGRGYHGLRRSRGGAASGSTATRRSTSRCRASPGSTRCSRCPRRACSRTSSSCSRRDGQTVDYASSSTTSASRSTGPPRRLARSGGRAKDLARYIVQGPGARARAPQAALGRQEAVPAHELALGLHRRGDALPARRRAARVPELAELLRRRHHRRREAGLLHRAAAVPRARAGRRAGSARRTTLERGQGLRGRQPRRARAARRASAASACSTSATTSTATSCARRSRRCGAPA